MFIQAIRRAAVAVEKLAEVAREELPNTMATILQALFNQNFLSKVYALKDLWRDYHIARWNLCSMHASDPHLSGFCICSPWVQRIQGDLQKAPWERVLNSRILLSVFLYRCNLTYQIFKQFDRWFQWHCYSFWAFLVKKFQMTSRAPWKNKKEAELETGELVLLLLLKQYVTPLGYIAAKSQ